MENESVINFLDFIKDKKDSKVNEFNKSDFDEFFIPKDTIEEEEEVDDHDEELEEIKEQNITIIEDIIEEKIDNQMDNYYSLFKDISENFSCDISIEGADISEAKVRLVIESNEWSLVFNGDIDSKGKCNIPIKKLNILNEGSTGKIRLEVIADGNIFTPWEDEFKVKLSKNIKERRLTYTIV